MPKISLLLSPLNNKLSQKEFNWNNDDSNALKRVWNALFDSTVLNLPNPNAPFELHTDASGLGIASVLIQNSKLIRLFSAKLNSTEQKYSAIELEALAIVKSILSFRCLLANTKAYVNTDNLNLTKNTNSLTLRTKRLKLVFSEFDVRLVYKPGLRNQAADLLSRLKHREFCG